jgi:hypothetical protein
VAHKDTSAVKSAIQVKNMPNIIIKAYFRGFSAGGKILAIENPRLRRDHLKTRKC